MTIRKPRANGALRKGETANATTIYHKLDRSALPTARNFYQREGLTPGRPNKSGWARCKGKPPCHKSKSGNSFAVNLDHGGFLCHGCGAKGDIIGFVCLRDGCDFKTSCKTLGIWRENLTPTERIDIAKRESEREAQRQRDAECDAAQRRERLKLRNELHQVSKLYRHW